MNLRKSINMASMLKTPVLGVVENMRTMVLPTLRQRNRLVRRRQHSTAHSAWACPLLASLPWRKDLAQFPARSDGPS
jgi:Mrp family chromosome partitioning ATPase